MTIRYVLTMIVATVCLFVLSTRASAGGPLIEESVFTVDNEPIANCGDFHIIANGSGKNRLITYFDGNGDPIRLTFQGRYRGTLTNSVTGFSLDDAPSVANIFVDLVEGTQTNIGAFFTVTVPGGGTVLIEAGRIVFAGAGPPAFIAGPHLPPDQQIDALCSALR